MDADDLVITLKKSLAKLSRTERRKAVELVGDVVRAAMFDDAAGDGYEVERCPRCGSVAIVKKGKSRNGEQRYLCRDCGRTFSGSTGRVLGTSKLPRETWMAYAVSVNIFFTIFTNVFSPIAPTRMRRIRLRGCAAFGV